MGAQKYQHVVSAHCIYTSHTILHNTQICSPGMKFHTQYTDEKTEAQNCMWAARDHTGSKLAVSALPRLLPSHPANHRLHPTTSILKAPSRSCMVSSMSLTNHTTDESCCHQEAIRHKRCVQGGSSGQGRQWQELIFLTSGWKCQRSLPV